MHFSDYTITRGDDSSSLLPGISEIVINNTSYEIQDVKARDVLMQHEHDIWMNQDSVTSSKSIANQTLTTLFSINITNYGGAQTIIWTRLACPANAQSNPRFSAVLTSSSSGDVEDGMSTVTPTGSYTTYHFLSTLWGPTGTCYCRVWHNCGSAKTIYYKYYTLTFPETAN